MAYTSVVSKKSKDLQDKGNLTGALLDLANLLKVGPQVEGAVGSGDLDILDSAYDKAVQENMGARLEGPSEIEESKQVAADIHQDQKWADIIKTRAGDNAYTAPELNEERELEELSDFAESKGKSPEDVARSPMLYEEFARHLGKKYMVLSPDKYMEYDESGNSATGQRADTPYYSPRHLSNILPEDNFAFDNPKTPDEGIANKLARKVHRNLEDTLSAGTYGPSMQSKIAASIEEEGNYDAKEFADFVLKYISGYAAIAEQDPSAGRMFSDVGLHALLAQAKKNVWQHRLEQEQAADEGYIPSFDDKVMTSVAHDMHIGHMTLEALGNEKPTPGEAGMAGSLVRHLVGYSLGAEEGKTDADSLFEIGQTEDKENHRVAKTLVLTKRGLDLAHMLEPLTNELIPSSVKHVRYDLKPAEYYEDTSKAISRKLRGIEGLDHGDLSERLRWLQVQENTPVRVHDEGVNLIKALHYNVEANKLFDGGSFLGIKGDGIGNRGSSRNRPGFVYQRDKHGRIVDQDGNPTKNLELAAKIDDVSDAIKDTGFMQTLKWALDHVGGKIFFYDYFYGFNNRLYADQTIGNFQGSKMPRGLLASGIDEIYSLRPGSKDLLILKAGIMKRFGHDKKGVEDAAAEFDLVINEWTKAYQDLGGQGGIDIVNYAGKEEGWASLTAIAEAVKLQQAITNLDTSYSSGFLVEIDGLTNGMAWSAVQSGDYKVAGASNMFSQTMYDSWLAGEEFQDSYEMVDDEARRLLGGLWNGEKGLATLKDFSKKVVSEKFKTALNAADNEKLKQAMRIVQEHGGVMGRKFAKKPVMIFGYGAGGARISQGVVNFLSDLYIEKPGIVDSFAEAGIDIEKDFAEPLSIYMTQAVTGSFEQVAKLANDLSLAASLANEQGLTFVLPTDAGFNINLGKAEYELDIDSRRTYSHATGKHRIDKNTGEMVPIKKRGSTYNFIKLFNRTAEGDTEGSLKAASQVTVLLNHANDSININRAITNMHDKLSVGGTNRNTALQVFDGLFATPKKAGSYTNELNDVFRMINENSSHAQRVFDALTFELNPGGSKVPEAQGKGGNRKSFGIPVEDQKFKRKLTAAGVEMAKEGDLSTWDPSLDGEAFDWNIEGNRVALPDGSTRFVPGPVQLRNKLNELRKNNKKIMKDLPHIFQFFWDKSRDKYS